MSYDALRAVTTPLALMLVSFASWSCGSDSNDQRYPDGEIQELVWETLAAATSDSGCGGSTAATPSQSRDTDSNPQTS